MVIVVKHIKDDLLISEDFYINPKKIKVMIPQKGMSFRLEIDDECIKQVNDMSINYSVDDLYKLRRLIINKADIEFLFSREDNTWSLSIRALNDNLNIVPPKRNNTHVKINL